MNGEPIPGYQIEGRLGCGGFGCVYKGRDTSAGRNVAIKITHRHLLFQPGVFDSFQREMNIASQLRHPNITEFLGPARSEKSVYYIMEYLGGGNLRDFINRKGKLSITELIPIMFGVLEGLAYAHQAEIRPHFDEQSNSLRGVVHRDIKPENILLSNSAYPYSPKIGDLGLAKAFESAGVSRMTSTGDWAGTPTYWPREHLTHYKYLTPPSDVFSIAAVLYEALTGHLVRDWPRSPTVDVILQLPIVPIRERDASISQGVADVIDRALREASLDFDVSQNAMKHTLGELRYKDAGEFKDALAKALA